MENLSHSRLPHKVSGKDCTGDGNASSGGAPTRHGNFSGGPHKLLNPILSPRVEDYSEIFGSFNSRASSIPVLDLPEVDEAELYFDVRSSGFDYSEVFGDFDGVNFAPLYEELFRQSMGVNVADSSSEEAWTPVETESMSKEFDHFGKDPCFSIEDPNNSFGGSPKFTISYNKADQSISEELSNELRRMPQVQAIPGYTFLVDQTNPLPKTVSKSPSLSLADNNSHSIEHNGETMGVKQFRKVMSHPHHAADGRETFVTDLGPQRGYGIEGSRSKGFISISEISLQTEPSHLPPPSRPPPLLDVKKGDASRLIPNCKSSNSDGTPGCSPPFFDVEVDASSSAATSAAAMKKAMRKAQAKMKSAKELMERNKEGFQGDTKPDLRNSISNEERHLAKRSAEEKCGRRSFSSQGSGKIDGADEWLDLEATQFFELVRTNKPRKAARQTNEEQILVHNSKVFEHGPKENRASMETYEQPEENGKTTKSLGQEYELEEKKLKVAEEVSNLEENIGRPKAAKDRHKLKEHEKKVKMAQEVREWEETEMNFGMAQLHLETQNVDGAARTEDFVEVQQNFEVEQAKKNKEKELKLKGARKTENDIKTKDIHKSGSYENEKRVKEALRQGENEKFKDIIKREEKKKPKEACERAENEKRWVEALQKVESENRLQGGFELGEDETKLQEAHEWEEKEKRQRKYREREEKEKRLKEAHEREENEKKLREASEWEDKERRQRKTREREENEKRLKEAHEREENEKKLREVREWEDKERRQRKAREREENEKRLKVACEKEENEKKLRQIREWEDKEKSQRKAREREENEKRLKVAREKEENEKKLRETREWEDKEKSQRKAREREENEKRLKVAREREENEKKLMEASERKDKERRQRKAREREENENKLKGTHERKENEKRLIEAHEREGNEKRLVEACEKEEYEKRLKEAREREENEKRFKFAREREEYEKRRKEACEREENETTCKEALERKENEKRWREGLEQEESGKKQYKAQEREDNEKRFYEASEKAEVENSVEFWEQGDNIKILKMDLEREESEVMIIEAFMQKETEMVSKEATRWRETESMLNDTCERKDLKGLNKVHQQTEKDEKLDLPSVTKKVYAVKDNGNVKDDPEDNERKSDAIMENLADERKKASSITQANSEQKVENAVESHLLDGNVQKAGEVGIGMGQTCVNKCREHAFYQGGNKHKFMSTQMGKDWVENGGEIEADQPAVLEMKGNKKKVDKLVNGKHSTVRIEKDSNQTCVAEEKETERIKRERELEQEHLKKIEEEMERERERAKDRMAVDRPTLESHESACEKAERAAMERARAEAQQRALIEARERLEKACAEAREKSLPMEARLRTERSAAERAATETQESSVFETRERIERSVSDKFSGFSRNGGMQQSFSSSDLQDLHFQRASSFASSRNLISSVSGASYFAERSEGIEGESDQRCRARLERHRRTAERAAKALEEKNIRDLLALREQAERNRLSETLDAEVKRWSGGKERNLRALLSTLQYILGSDSGWQPIPLTEVITNAAVKKAYRKATLCVHPDKLQQRGASIQQKYICEKVFDLLKEAWNKFNSEEW